VVVARPFVDVERGAVLESRLVVADRRALAIAGRQHGVITAAQLVRAGHTRAAIRHRVKNGWLRRLHRGVYLVGPIEPPLARAMAATLACGDGALLSHYPAAVLWGLRPAPAGTMHVTVAGRHRDGPAGVTVHRVERLHPADATRRHGIPVTAPARVLLDIAAHVTPRELERATNEARTLRLVSDHSLNAQFARYPRHRGGNALRAAESTEPRLTRSEAERRLLELIRAARLPEPETNVRLHGHEVDFHWPELDLVVEVDGYEFHSSRAAFERDRRRDAELHAHGVDVLRVTWAQIADEPTALVATLARATASASAARGTCRRSGDRGRAG
jgi:very-short-patch-repair endonuclease